MRRESREQGGQRHRVKREQAVAQEGSAGHLLSLQPREGLLPEHGGMVRYHRAGLQGDGRGVRTP